MPYPRGLEHTSPSATRTPPASTNLALPEGEFEEMFDRLPEDDPERPTLALEVNREYQQQAARIFEVERALGADEGVA